MTPLPQCGTETTLEVVGCAQSRRYGALMSGHVDVGASTDGPLPGLNVRGERASRAPIFTAIVDLELTAFQTANKLTACGDIVF